MELDSHPNRLKPSADAQEKSGGLRSQIRMLAEAPDDEVAELAETLSAQL